MPCSEKEHHTWPNAFSSLVLAYANRYPNPLSNHIHTQDILSCTYDADSDTLHTKKLILKSGKLPRWAPKGIIARAETWVVEESSVNVLNGQASYLTRNIDHLSVLEVEELMHFRRISPNETATVVSVCTASAIGENYAFGSLLSNRIAKYGVSSFKRNLGRSRSSLSLTLSYLSHPQYRKALLHPSLQGPYSLPDPAEQRGLFIDRSSLASSFQHWELIGSGFSGHGVREVEEHYPPDLASSMVKPPPIPPHQWWRQIRSRPDFVSVGDWAFWLSRWRPKRELSLFPSTRMEKKDEHQLEGERGLQGVRNRLWAFLQRNGWVREKKDQ